MDKTFSIQGAVVEVLQNLGRGAVSYAPRLVTAVILVIIGFVIAKLVQVIVGQVLHRAKFDAGLERLGLMPSLQRIGIQDVSRGLIPTTLFWLLLLVFVQSAAEMVGLAAIAAGITGFFAFLPNLFSAFLILVMGQTLGEFLGHAVTSYAKESGASFARSLGGALSGLTVGVAVIIALGQLRVDTRILNILTIVIFSGVSLGFALTFGLGTREATRNLIAGFYARRMFSAGDDLEIGGHRGTLRAVAATQTLIESSEGVELSIPNATLLDQVVRRRGSLPA